MRCGRAVVLAKRGMVCSAHPLASGAGIRVLREGGSFIDAALATAAVMNVVEPANNQLGGDVFMLAYTKKDGRVTALNGSGAAPGALSPESFPDGIPTRGPSSATVPGEVHGWLAAHARWGTMPLSRLFEDAIHYAETGFPANPRYAGHAADAASNLTEWSDLLALVAPEGRAPRVGDIVRQPAVARTLRLIAEGGIEAYYRGPIAAAIARHVQSLGGCMTEEDFAAHQTEVQEPISTRYRGLTIYEQPPVSQGHILLEELNIVEAWDLAALGTQSVEGIHLMVEAKKRAFADRLATMGDHRRVRTPLRELLSKPYARSRAATIDPSRASEVVEPGLPGGRDTTYFCVADGEGNAVSWIQSLFHGFGCAVCVPEVGVILNNRLTGFSLEAGHPNVLEPGKRPMHTLNTFLVTDGERLRVVGGTPGGDVQVQTNLQSITHLLDARMSVQEAAEAPKWHHDAAQGSSGTVHVESRLPESVVDGLRALGHRVQVNGPWTGSCAVQLIEVHPESGALMGGSDPRADGCAVGY